MGSYLPVVVTRANPKLVTHPIEPNSHPASTFLSDCIPTVKTVLSAFGLNVASRSHVEYGGITGGSSSSVDPTERPILVRYVFEESHATLVNVPPTNTDSSFSIVSPQMVVPAPTGPKSGSGNAVSKRPVDVRRASLFLVCPSTVVKFHPIST